MKRLTTRTSIMGRKHDIAYGCASIWKKKLKNDRYELIDYDRRETGDYYKKPTQYWFINCKPKNNFIFEGIDIKNTKRISLVSNQVERSMISKDYANRFIREYIIDIKN